ncbi:MAG: hypothetical protein VX672_09320 [Planctomycetota bacterium]|nr:hypothetical protein [Planctomycetota bacterium]
MRTFTLILRLAFPAVLATGCAAPSISTVDPDEAIAAVERFFERLDVDGFEADRTRALLTDDFRIYEMGVELDWPGLVVLFGGYEDGRTISTDWTLSDFRVDTDAESAHVFYRNHGVFRSRAENGEIEVTTMDWLESAYLVRREGVLKLRFLQSDDVERTSRTIPAEASAR